MNKMTDMKRFNALKKVKAKPMSRVAYNNLRGWALPPNEDGADEGYLTVDINGTSDVEGYDGYVSWTPKAMFDDQFYAVEDDAPSVKCTAPQDPDHELTEAEVEQLAETGSLCDCVEVMQVFDECPIQVGDEFDFGSAVYLLKTGKKVARVGWNGKGMFVYYVPAASYPAQRNTKGVLVGDYPEDMVPYAAYLALKTASGEVVPWTVSQSDALATDWMLYDDTTN